MHVAAGTRARFSTLVVLVLALPPGAATAAAQAQPPAVAAGVAGQQADTLERHPLELRALVEPEAVLRELPVEIINAKLAGDWRRLALLYLAEANACRVVADWDCQREAGLQAQDAALEARAQHLVVRGIIAESRGRLAMQDYTRSARRLDEAERILKDEPQPELLADVMLAYSSMSNSLGKHALAADYAERGLAELGPGEGLAMRARLLRNLARARARLGDIDAAQRALEEATGFSRQLDDPKLEAELYLEAARVARFVGDQETQRRNGERVLAMGAQLRNTQLAGLGHEVLGLAAVDSGDSAMAQRELGAAQDSFRKLDLRSDELRVLRELVTLLVRSDPAGEELPPLFQRYLVLDNAITENERSQAADDFDARLRYAERENEVTRLQGETALARAREEALARTNQLSRAMVLLTAALLLTVGVFVVWQRRINRRLHALLREHRQSELQYRTLADNASDLVVRIGDDGSRNYVSPSSREVLGLDPAQLQAQGWDHVHPDDLPGFRAALARLEKQGQSTTVLYRGRHAQGHLVWLETIARRVMGPDGTPEVVCAARDVSTRIRAEQALESVQARLRAVTDNIPALIAHIDNQERYSFINDRGTRLFGIQQADVIGRTVREVRGEEIYSEVKEHIASALRGHRVTFEGQAAALGQSYRYQTSYVPDIGPDGIQNGFFSFTFDITELKDAEQRLEQMARFDSLTGLANRRYFDERFGNTVARCRRQGSPLALLYLDIDRFKQINDSHGHAVGDQVLRQFAARLKSCVREGDLAARIGGDEFVLLAEGATTPADADAIAAKITSVMQRPWQVAGKEQAITASIGVAFSRGGAGAEALMAAADGALYQAKAAGRNTSRQVEID
jgi:diguanylate cyclase (GGDEF)-like protein/PAS domain S-box-containing protein